MINLISNVAKIEILVRISLVSLIVFTLSYVKIIILMNGLLSIEVF